VTGSGKLRRMSARTPLFAAILISGSLCLAQAPSATTLRPNSPAARHNSAPDIIFVNGVIYTGEGFNQDKPETVDAMAIGGGKVLAVGTNEEIRKLAGPKTRVRDLQNGVTGIFIFPGINDAHVHLGFAAQTRMNVDLTGVKSLAEMMAKVQAFAKNAPPGHWLTGGNWDHTLWPQKMLPTRQELDKVTAGHPAFLSRIDGHIALANSAALKAAGITGKTLPPQGGAIDLDSNGEPTGILRESAQQLVEKVIPPPSHDERRRGLPMRLRTA